MPTYNRIEEPDRWDIVNYIRSLQGKTSIRPDTTHGFPGETGRWVPGPSQMAPSRHAPSYRQGGTPTPVAAPADSTRPTTTPRDTTARGAPPARPATEPSTPKKP